MSRMCCTALVFANVFTAVFFDVPLSERQYRQGDIPESHVYDPYLARRLLREEGWRDTDGDGVSERGDQAFRFELIVPQEVAGAGVFIQDQLRRVVDRWTGGVDGAIAAAREQW